MTTPFHSGTPDDVLILALRDHSDPAVTELLARYIPFVGIDIDDVVMRDDHEEKLAEKDEKIEDLEKKLKGSQDAAWKIAGHHADMVEKIEKYKAALIHARSELATMSETLGNLSDKIAGELDETV